MDSNLDEENERYGYRYMMNRDKRRWAKADQDDDGVLSKTEFSDFLHPEEVEHMQDVVIDVSRETVSKLITRDPGVCFAVRCGIYFGKQ